MASIAKRLEGKVAIITGGASGIGAATAKLFIKHGAKVIIADIQDELGHSLCKTLETNNNILYIHCDVTCDSDVKNMVETAVSKYGKLDIMYNNAGISGGPNETLLDTNNEGFKRVFDVNVYGAFLGAKHAARFMIPEKKGVILFTASVASILSGQASNAYTASKHALVGLMKGLCLELGEYGIRVNCISPAGIATPLFNNAMKMNENDARKVLSSINNVLKGEVLEVEDIAEAALYLSSDESKFVSGLNLVLDGGYTTTNTSFISALKGLMKSTTELYSTDTSD